MKKMKVSYQQFYLRTLQTVTEVVKKREFFRLELRLVSKQSCGSLKEQGRKRPLDTPKKMIERREREGEREKERY